MPELKDIELFKSLLNSLGDEPAVLSKRGRTIEDVAPPEEGVAEDISRLFSDSGLPSDLDGDEELDTLPEEVQDREPPEFEESSPSENSEETEDLGFFNTLDFEDQEGTGPDSFGGDNFPEADQTVAEEFGFNDLPGLDDQEGPAEEASGTEEDFDFDDLPGLEEAEGGDEDFSFSDEMTQSLISDPEGKEVGEEDFSLEEGEEAALDESTEDFSLGSGEDEGGEFSLDEADGFSLDEPEELSLDEIEDLDELGSDDPSAGEGGDSEEFGLSDFGIPDEEPLAGDFSEEESVSDLPEVEEFTLDDEDLGFGDLASPAEEDPSGFSDANDFDGEEADELPSVDDEGVEDFDISDFNLGDLGDHFGLEDESSGEDDAELGPVPSFSAAAQIDEVGFAEDDFGLKGEEFDLLKENLSRMPRNLKLIIEEQIGEKGLSGEPLNKVLKALVTGAKPKEIAAVLSKVTGEKITIPAQYEKFSGLAFEEEKGSFSYVFRHTILPVLRVFLLGALVMGILTFLVYRYVYTPLYATSLYRTGIEEISLDNYRGGNEYFNRAVEKWRVKKWYFTYAEAFAAKKQYPLAEEKYEELLAVPAYRNDTRALMDYARLESETLGKYREAEGLLKRIFNDDPYHKEALLLAGDNYLRWGDEIDEEKWEEARYHYALLMQKYGQKDQYLFRMLRYLIRMDQYADIIAIKESFQANPKAKIEADGYAELAEYLLDRDEPGDVMALLNRAREVDPFLPEVYYQYARYFKRMKDQDRETQALRTTLELLEGQEPATRKRLEMLILSRNRMGEILNEKGDYLDAEKEYRTALDRYQEALALRRLEPRDEFGKIYANLGDLYYYVAGDYNTALDLYIQGEENRHVTPDILYRRGYIYFRREDYRRSLNEFYTSAGGFTRDPNLLYATAAALYRRNDFFSAQGYYIQLIEQLERQRSVIPVLLIDEKEEHRALVENLMMAYNNLGVTLNRLYLSTGDPQKNADSLVQFARSSDYFDYLSRDPETMRRSSTINLAHINTKTLFYPLTDYQLQIYGGIPVDRQALSFR